MDNLYYRRRRRRKRSAVTPFLILVCIVVIIILAIQIIMGLRVETTEKRKNQAFMFLERGEAEFQIWGEEQWHDAYNSKVSILEGDRIRTSDNSYVVLEFYDQSRLRLNSGTEIVIEKLESTRKGIDVHVRLHSGEIWINELDTEENLGFRVLTSYLDVTSVGTRYAVAFDDQEFVRVLEGEVKVLVADTSIQDAEILESVSVGIGQQISVNSTDIADLEARKFVNLLESIDDYWRVTEWHLWNIREDEDPSEYVVDTEALEEAEEEREELVNPEDVDEGEESEEIDFSEPVEEIVVPTPEVTVTNPPETPYTLEDKRIYLKGEVSEDVTKVIVTEFYDDPEGVPYELSKFVPGSGVWNYAAGLDFGNLKKGKNRFVVQAYNSDGLVSDPVEIILNIPGEEGEDEEVADEVEEVEEVEVPEVVADIVVPTPVVEDSEPEEPVIEAKPITQTKPVITSFEATEKTADNYFVTTEKRVVINGFTGGAEDVQKVIVNGWPLSLYEPGSRQWTYYAKSSIGTLQRGVNVYNVYTENSAGERSLSLTFTIEKQ